MENRAMVVANEKKKGLQPQRVLFPRQPTRFVNQGEREKGMRGGERGGGKAHGSGKGTNGKKVTLKEKKGRRKSPS